MKLGLSLSLAAAARRRSSLDPDAADLFARIVAAGSTISAANRIAVEAFIRGIKQDAGVATMAAHPIKAACILAAADTLAGALVPLVGPAPTNISFADGDYSRTTGLLGNGSTKYLITNRNNNADPQNNRHLAVWLTSNTATPVLLVGCGAGNDSGRSGISRVLGIGGGTFFRLSSGAASSSLGLITDVGLIACSRAASGSFTARVGGSNSTVTETSQTPQNESIGVFGRSNGTGIGNQRMSFYSIGESLDLALLDARLATLMSALT